MTPSKLARGGLLALTSGVAAVTFTISFHGLDGFGLHVMRLGALSPLVPAGVDLASLVALLAAHMRRGEPWGRRTYAWTVFMITAALSVAGNIADGIARGLVPAGLVGVAMAPVVFVLVSHLAITSWRAPTARRIDAPPATKPAVVPPVDPPRIPAMSSPSTPAPATPRPPVVPSLSWPPPATVAPRPVVSPPASSPPRVVPSATRQPATPPAKAPAPKVTSRPTVESGTTAAKVATLRAEHPGLTQQEAAERLGVSVRSVQRYWSSTEAPTNGKATALADALT